MATTGPLLTSFQAAVLLGKSPRTIQRMARAGDLRIVQKLPGPNGALLFDKAELEYLLSKSGHEVDGAA